MRERTSPLFGINQMLVSATGGERSSPSKNHVKIGSLRKLTCERFFRMATCHSPIFSTPSKQCGQYERKSPVDKAVKVAVQVPAKEKILFCHCLFMI